MLNKIKSDWDTSGEVYSGRKDGLTGIVIFTTRNFIFITHEVIHEYNGNNLREGGTTYSEQYRMIGINARKSHRIFRKIVLDAIEYVDNLIGT